MATNDTQNKTTIKRGRGRPRKLNTSGLEVNTSLSSAVELALAQVLNGASVKGSIREMKSSEYSGTLIKALPKKQGQERLVIGRRQTQYRGKTYDFVDIRTFYFAHDVDKWLPTTKGVTFPTADAGLLIDALKDAVNHK